MLSMSTKIITSYPIKTRGYTMESYEISSVKIPGLMWFAYSPFYKISWVKKQGRMSFAYRPFLWYYLEKMANTWSNSNSMGFKLMKSRLELHEQRKTKKNSCTLQFSQWFSLLPQPSCKFWISILHNIF